jgi:hypothetical protein
MIDEISLCLVLFVIFGYVNSKSNYLLKSEKNNVMQHIFKIAESHVIT